MDHPSLLGILVGIGATVGGTGVTMAPARLGRFVTFVGMGILVWAGYGLLFKSDLSILGTSLLAVGCIAGARVWDYEAQRRLRLQSSEPYMGLDTVCFVVEPAGWLSGSGEAWESRVISIKIKNSPKVAAESAIAKGLTVKFTCRGVAEGGKELDLPWLDGRNSYSDQPKLLGPPVKLDFDLGIDNPEAKINLVIKKPDSNDCYLFNNDSFQYPYAQNPKWRIPPGRFIVIVNVSGTGVRKRFECSFLNSGYGKGLLVGDDKRELPWQPVP
jgi:hypothetical protein